MSLVRFFPVVVALVTAGCFAPVDSNEDVGQGSDAIAPSGADAARILDFVNYPGTSAATLRLGVGLDIRAAQNIVAHRDGADGKVLTADDKLFNDIAELDAVSYVAAAAFQKLSTYAAEYPAPAGETVETVPFKGWEAEAVRWGLNNATVEELDVDVPLNSTAAKNLVAKAPYANVTAAGKVAQVGKAALLALRAHAPIWWNEMHAVRLCAPQVTAAVAPVIDKVLYMSESDRPFTPVSLATSKTGAITFAELSGLLGVSASQVNEVRDADWFFNCDNFYSDDPAVTAEQKCTQLHNVLSSDLTNLTVIRFGTIEVQTYVVGRTSCGEIAGVATVAIET